jgi:GT2 family glycosyltransferase
MGLFRWSLVLPMSVMITYPHPNVVSHTFSWSLLNTFKWHSDKIDDIRPIRCYPGDSLVIGRNLGMKVFLESTSEWLWTIDTDMGWPPDTLPRLMEHGPVASALYHTVREIGANIMGGPEGWERMPLACRKLGEGYAPFEKYEGVMKVDAVGAGCLLIHRSAVEKVQEYYGDNWWTIHRKLDGSTLGEDYSLCWRLEQCGIPIMCDTTIPVSHHKQVWI